MRACIISLNLYSNYGGILQAFALQRVLAHLNVDSVLAQRVLLPHWLFRLLCQGRYFALKMGGRMILKWLCPAIELNYLALNPASRDKILKAPNTFIKNHIRTLPVRSGHRKKLSGFDAYIVGSDQVWRKAYADPFFFFLDFLPPECTARKIAYSASFGIDEWDYSGSQTLKCRELVKRFHRISIREHSGVVLCRKYLCAEAEEMVDPTLLLSADDYRRIYVEKVLETRSGDLFVYLLDKTEEKTKIVSDFSVWKRLQPDYFMPAADFQKDPDARLEHCIFRPVEEWLAGIDRAKFVITDSFHGTVFSILFHKPFAVIGNQARGNTRMQSLLYRLGLSERMVSSAEEISALPEIDYKKTEEILNQSRSEAICFLRESLFGAMNGIETISANPDIRSQS